MTSGGPGHSPLRVRPALLCLFLALATLLVDVRTPLGVAGGVPYIAAVFASLYTMSRGFVLSVAAGCSALTLIGYFLSPPGGATWIVLFNRGLALFAIWVTVVAGLRYSRIKIELIRITQMWHKEALKEVALLKSLLPICAWCKKIRDDRGYWLEVEEYIADHSDSEFTHSVCPDCARTVGQDLGAR